MFFGGTLVEGDLGASGFPVRWVARAAALILTICVLVWPAAFQAGFTSFAEHRAAQMQELLLKPMLDRLTEIAQTTPPPPAPSATTAAP